MNLHSKIYPDNNPHGLIDCGVIFSERDHSYFLDGEPLSGITGMIGKHIFPKKYSGIPNNILKAAAEKGKRIHKELGDFDNFGECENEVQKSYRNLNIQIIADEYLVTDFKNYSTAIDKVAIIDNEIWIGDVKTTYILDEDYVSWQLTIGKLLFEKVNPGLEVKGMFAVHVKNDIATFVEIESKDTEEARKLLQIDVNGKKYQNYEVSTVENEKALSLVQQIADLTQMAKDIKMAEKKMRESLAVEFDKLDVKKWETDNFVISKTKDYVRKSFDAKKYKELHPDEVADYEKETIVKGGVKIKLK